MSKDDFTARIVANHSVIGLVITQATMTEGMINAYIAEYYTRHPGGDYQNSYLSFIYDILNNKFISLNTKVDILFKVFERIDGNEVSKGNRKFFEAWLKIRNMLAHGNMLEDKLLYSGEYHDIQDLVDKASKLQFRIHAVMEQYSQLRGPYFNHFPLKKTGKTS